MALSRNYKFILIWSLVPLAIFVLIFILTSASLSKPKKIISISPNGIELPDFSLKSLEEDKKELSSKDLSNKYSIINIFASWCITCLQEHDNLMYLSKIDNINLYGINWRDKKENARRWLKEHGNPYDNIGYDFQGDVIISLGVKAAPETLLVSPDNKIIFRHRGVLTKKIIDETILKIING